MIDYTPDTEEVRENFAHWHGDYVQEWRDAFDRWLAQYTHTAKAEALTEAADALEGNIVNVEVFTAGSSIRLLLEGSNDSRRQIIHVLRNRAQQLTEG